jgi:hypothetical protein
MRAQLLRHLDVVVVVWALALGLAWTLVVLSRTETGDTQWCSWEHSGPAWIVGD